MLHARENYKMTATTLRDWQEAPLNLYTTLISSHQGWGCSEPPSSSACPIMLLWPPPNASIRASPQPLGNYMCEDGGIAHNMK